MNCRFIQRRALMPNWFLFAASVVYIGIGSWASIFSDESKGTRLLGIISLIAGMGVLSYTF
jgi:hypothetical protein